MPEAIVCRIHSPRNPEGWHYTDLAKARERIAQAREAHGYLFVGVVGTRDPAPSMVHGLATLHEAVQKLCKQRGYQESHVCIVSGGARGWDTYAEQFAHSRNLPLIVFPADWTGPLGRGAGPARNQHIVDVADEIVAFPRKERNAKGEEVPAEEGGTFDTIHKARLACKPVTIL